MTLFLREPKTSRLHPQSLRSQDTSCAMKHAVADDWNRLPCGPLETSPIMEEARNLASRLQRIIVQHRLEHLPPSINR